MGARLPRAAEPQRADQEGRRRAQRPRAHREHLRQARASTPSTPPTCAAGSAGGASTPSASPASTAAGPRCSRPEELDDRYFMLRVRIDGGALTTAQLRALGEISHDFARDTADITDRQNIQYHWIRIEDVPEIWQRLEAVGLQTTEACGDSPRVDPRLARWPASRPTRSSTRTPAIDEIVAAATSATPSSPTCRASSRPRSSGAQQRRRARDQRRLVRRRRAPRARPRLRPVGRRRPVHQPDAGPAARRLGAARRGARRLGGRRRRSSATTATAGCAPGPG